MFTATPDIIMRDSTDAARPRGADRKCVVSACNRCGAANHWQGVRPNCPHCQRGLCEGCCSKAPACGKEVSNDVGGLCGLAMHHDGPCRTDALSWNMAGAYGQTEPAPLMLPATHIRLTPAQVAEALCELNDEEQAQVFIETAKIATGWANLPGLIMPTGWQWFKVGRHLRECACATPDAREIVREMYEGMESAP